MTDTWLILTEFYDTVKQTHAAGISVYHSAVQCIAETLVYQSKRAGTKMVRATCRENESCVVDV